MLRPATPTVTRELLQRYRAGNLRAEEQLFDRFRVKLVERARRHPLLKAVARQASADDVVQEVFWRVLSSGALMRFEDRGRGSLESMLVTVLERTLVDTVRRHSAQKRGGGAIGVAGGHGRDEQDDPIDALESTGTTPTSNARAGELIARARELLSEREWAAWEQVELNGRTAEEYAAQAGSTSSSVRGLLLRARTRLASALSAERRPPNSRSSS